MECRHAKREMGDKLITFGFGLCKTRLRFRKGDFQLPYLHHPRIRKYVV
jgi:hypothetical protein